MDYNCNIGCFVNIFNYKILRNYNMNMQYQFNSKICMFDMDNYSANLFYQNQANAKSFRYRRSTVPGDYNIQLQYHIHKRFKPNFLIVTIDKS